VNAVTQTIEDRRDYGPFGLSSPTLFQPFGFVGGVVESPTTVRLGARAYAPEVGRWHSKEQIQQFTVASSYLYAYNDPVNHIDPSGFAAQRPAEDDTTIIIKALFCTFFAVACVRNNAKNPCGTCWGECLNAPGGTWDSERCPISGDKADRCPAIAPPSLANPLVEAD